MSEPILDLTTFIERPTIRIDGEHYELRSLDEMSILEGQALTRDGREIEILAAGGTDPEGRLSGLLADVVNRIVIGLPDTVLEALSDTNRMAICEVFTGLLLRRRMAVAGAIARRMTGAHSNGESSSHGSSASTADTPPSGSTGSRSPSSGRMR
jgi:hypothetical protein